MQSISVASSKVTENYSSDLPTWRACMNLIRAISGEYYRQKALLGGGRGPWGNGRNLTAVRMSLSTSFLGKGKTEMISERDAELREWQHGWL